jgi:hypothetical protein
LFARVLALAAALVTPTGVCAAERAASLRDFLAEYRCPVVDRLQQMHAAFDVSHPQNWFLIVYLAARSNDYVQCVFDTKTQLVCEAASGFYDGVASEPRTRWLPKSDVAALGRLGFSTDDSAGNFQAWVDVTDPPDYGAIADLTLTALHDGFGARAGVTLGFEAPLAPHASLTCVPVS